MHRRRFVLFLVLAVVAAALLLPAVAPAMTYDQAVDQLYAKGYPQNVETYLNSLGTSPLGFRLGGTVADDAAARYLERKLRAAGYDNVKLEAVPVDEWAVRGASVTVDGDAPSCARSSPAYPAPARTASPPRSSTSATASPPTTRAST